MEAWFNDLHIDTLLAASEVLNRAQEIGNKTIGDIDICVTKKGSTTVATFKNDSLCICATVSDNGNFHSLQNGETTVSTTKLPTATTIRYIGDDEKYSITADKNTVLSCNEEGLGWKAPASSRAVAAEIKSFFKDAQKDIIKTLSPQLPAANVPCVDPTDLQNVREVNPNVVPPPITRR